jgi:anti-sigma B factor antagonist
MPDLPLAIEVVPHENATLRLLRLSGPLTLSNLFEFQSLVRAEDSRATIIDMSSVPYVDSAGIGCLIGAHVSHQRSCRKMALVGVCDRVRNVLKVTNVENLFTLHPNVEEAISAFARAAKA